LSYKEFTLHRYASFLLSFLAGILFSNPGHAQLVDAGAGENKAAPTGSFTITDVNLPGILFAHDGGTITASGGLTLDVTGNSNTGLGAAGTGSKITAHQVTLNFTGIQGLGAEASSGGTISITDSTLRVSSGGLAIRTGVGTINAPLGHTRERILTEHS
jgi:hypothetical protein